MGYDGFMVWVSYLYIFSLFLVSGMSWDQLQRSSSSSMHCMANHPKMAHHRNNKFTCCNDLYQIIGTCMQLTSTELVIYASLGSAMVGFGQMFFECNWLVFCPVVQWQCEGSDVS